MPKVKAKKPSKARQTKARQSKIENEPLLLRKWLKKAFCLVFALLFLTSQSQLFFAFEAYVVSVTARIEDGIADYLVINKVYYDVEPPFGNEWENEWVELYNPTDEPVDISGWIIEDNNAFDTLPPTTTIPAMGFAIITGNQTTFGYWEVPDDVVKIVLPDAKIGNGLSNESDRVILKTPDGTEIDAMSYGEDTYAFVPACPDVAPGHMLGRVPNGFDTNKASDWRDFGKPYVQVIFPNGGEVLYVGRTYTLEWLAVNPNGPDSDLDIAIWYSADSGSTWANIATSTENDGEYDWRAPVFIIDESGCYYVPSSRARIKVVATGPENFMVQDWDISDSDFCPPIDYSLLTEEERDYFIARGLPLSWFGIDEATSNEPVTVEPATTTDVSLVIASPQGEESPATSTEPVATTTQATTTQPVIIEPTSTSTQATTTQPIVVEPATTTQATTTEPVATSTDVSSVIPSEPLQAASEESPATATTTELVATTTQATSTDPELPIENQAGEEPEQIELSEAALPDETSSSTDAVLDKNDEEEAN